jgi:hypothetical protein
MSKRWQDMEDRIDRARDARRHGTKEDRKADRNERPSWRDIDKKRDGSNHTQQDAEDRDKGGRAAKDRYASAQAQKEAKGALEELFRDKKGESLKKDIIEADRAGLQAAIDAWIEAKGELPSNDAQLLERCLDARRDKTLRLVVEAIAVGLPDLDATGRKMLLLKMRNKARRTFDARLGRRIKELLVEHGVDE